LSLPRYGRKLARQTNIAQGAIAMSTVARVTEITSSSKKSFQDAIEKGIARAAKTLKNVEGAWIQDQKIVVEDGKIAAYRVNMKVTFILAD
jgi:dodecin